MDVLAEAQTCKMNQADDELVYPIKSDRYKLWLDFSILVSAHLALLPIWVLLWTLIPLLIWIGDRGPVFFVQQRVGKNGKVFAVRKFRTMVPDAAKLGPVWTAKDDPRVTRFGKVLRRTALDELPELLSILKRDMSFVGPRALDLEEQRALEEQVPGFEQRLSVLPGLTGLAQICDRVDDPISKFRYDQEYIRRLSPWLDCKILVQSVCNTVMARWDRRIGKGSWEESKYKSPIDEDSDAGN